MNHIYIKLFGIQSHKHGLQFPNLAAQKAKQNQVKH